MERMVRVKSVQAESKNEDGCLTGRPQRAHALLNLVARVELERLSYKVRDVDLSSQVRGNHCRGISVTQIEVPHANFPSHGSELEATVTRQEEAGNGCTGMLAVDRRDPLFRCYRGNAIRICTRVEEQRKGKRGAI